MHREVAVPRRSVHMCHYPRQQAGISGQELVKRGLVPGSLAERSRDQQTRNCLRGERLLTSLGRQRWCVCGPEAFPASSLALILFALSFAFRSCFLRHSFPTVRAQDLYQTLALCVWLQLLQIYQNKTTWYRQNQQWGVQQTGLGLKID